MRADRRDRASKECGSAAHTRRDALRAGALALSGAVLAGPALGGERREGRVRTRSSAHPGHARNVIFMCADGMSHGTLTLADIAIRQTTGERCAWMRLWERAGVRRALQDTASADALVTDSAAAASAWGIGVRVNNGAVNFTPDRREPEPILVTARAHGKATGLVTTTRVTHATPAGFIASVPDRDMEGPIAQQIMQRGVDVVLGGGSRHFPAETLGLRESHVVRTAEELSSAPAVLSKPLLGLFARSHVDYIINRPAEQASLEAMTRAALARLERSESGFVLQIEGGRVDHAAHANDAVALVTEQMEFDRTIQVVADWCLERDDTLVIITSDHGNANPGLTVYGREGARGMERLIAGRVSIETMIESARQGASGGDVLDRLVALIAEHRGFEMGERERRFLVAQAQNQATNPFAVQSNWTSLIGGLLANFYGVGFVSPNHTADHVELAAFGPGSEMVRPYLLNTDLHRIMVEAMDLVVR